MKCNFCMEKIDYGLANNLTPGVDRDATPACVNTCQARALTFGDTEDPNSAISKLIVDRKAFQLQRELGTDPSVYYVDGKIGGKLSNKAPKEAMTGSHITHLSSVEARCQELFGKGKREQ